MKGESLLLRASFDRRHWLYLPACAWYALHGRLWRMAPHRRCMWCGERDRRWWRALPGHPGTDGGGCWEP